LGVDLLVELLQAALQIACMTGLILDRKRLDQRSVRVSCRRDRRGLRVLVREDLQERLEVRVRLDVLRRQDAFVVGTLRTPFEKIASAWLSVVRYLTSAHASSLFFTPFGMPMIVPFT